MLVEDDEDLGDAILRRLRGQGHAVDWMRDGDAADDVLRYQDYDLIILDVGLPGMDGFELLRALRARGNRSSVLMLTARAGIDDRVTALDVGADDYLSKPFDFREFDARCRALLRRQQDVSAGETIVGALTFDRSTRRVSVDGVPIHLPNREYRLLEILLGNLGKVLTKEQIASRLFDFSDEAGDNAIELYIGRLRRKIGSAVTISTIRGAGYLAEAAAPDS
jgi:two-component system response regulator TctD